MNINYCLWFGAGMMLGKKPGIFLLICFVCILFIFTIPALGGSIPDVGAKGAVLMDAGSGRVLFEKEAHRRLPPASTTKIVTAILALEKGNLGDRVVVSKKAAETGGSAIWLEEGEVLTLEELLYAVLLSSANDAAVAVAEHVAGSEANFVRMMNRKAREIGARDTHFANPHGLHNEEHYSTAYDLALLGRYAMADTRFEKIVGTRKKVIPWAGHEWSRLLINKNKLIGKPRLYPGADGIKNGYTTQAGNCLVASATRNNMRLIAVVMDAPNATEEAIKLLDFGFDNFKKVRLVSRGEVVSKVNVRDYGPVKLVAAESLSVALKESEVDRVETVVSVPEEVGINVARGDVLGQVVYRLNGEVIGKVNLLASETVVKNTWLSSLWQIFLDIFDLLG